MKLLRGKLVTNVLCSITVVVNLSKWPQCARYARYHTSG